LVSLWIRWVLAIASAAIDAGRQSTRARGALQQGAFRGTPLACEFLQEVKRTGKTLFSPDLLALL